MTPTTTNKTNVYEEKISLSHIHVQSKFYHGINTDKTSRQRSQCTTMAEMVNERDCCLF
jgi:hypothetical protein